MRLPASSAKVIDSVMSHAAPTRLTDSIPRVGWAVVICALFVGPAVTRARQHLDLGDRTRHHFKLGRAECPPPKVTVSEPVRAVSADTFIPTPPPKSFAWSLDDAECLQTSLLVVSTSALRGPPTASC